MSSIDSLERYIDSVNEICGEWLPTATTNHLWYRGHVDCRWELVPKIYRDGHIDKYEREITRDFMLRASTYLDEEPDNKLEWLFIMQHFGVPTRLLDWTESYLTALFFAVENYKDRTNGCVWVLDPWSFNTLMIGKQSVLISSHPMLDDYVLNDDENNINRIVKADYPVAIRPKRNTRRIVAQKGQFIIYGSRKDSLNSLLHDKNGVRLKKLEIDGQAKLQILKQLYRAGITHSVLFPELSGLSIELSNQYSSDFIQNNDSVLTDVNISHYDE